MPLLEALQIVATTAPYVDKEDGFGILSQVRPEARCCWIYLVPLS